jgi:hypothetical protein
MIGALRFKWAYWTTSGSRFSGVCNVMMRRTLIPAAIAILITSVATFGVAAVLYHSVFFYKADGVMSPKTAVRVGLMTHDEALSSRGLAFKKSESGGYVYREGRVIAFIDGTNRTSIDLATECERLGGCEVRK